MLENIKDKLVKVNNETFLGGLAYSMLKHLRSFRVARIKYNNGRIDKLSNNNNEMKSNIEACKQEIIYYNKLLESDPQNEEYKFHIRSYKNQIEYIPYDKNTDQIFKLENENDTLKSMNNQMARLH